MEFLNDIVPINTENTANTTNINNPPIIIDPEAKYYHKNYLSFLLILMIAFLIMAYYLYYVAKNNLKKAKNANINTTAIYSKYEIFKNLSIANLSNNILNNFLVRGISIIYILISFNKNNDDLISFFNYFAHVFPSLFFFSVFFSYIRFLIEKFYEIKIKKKDIFFNPSMQFFNIMVYIVIFIITLSCLTVENYSTFNYLSSGLICILSLILSLLYLYYGVRLANIYSNEKESTEIKEKKFVHNRVFLIINFRFFLFH